MRKLLSHIFFSALFLLAGHSGIAQEKVYKGVIPNLTVNPQLFFVENSNPLIVTDPVYADVNIRPLLGPVLKMQNVVMLKINEEVLQYVPNNFITDVTVEITKTKLDGTQEAPIQKMLHLDYKIGMAQKSDAASYYVDDNGGYSITIVIKIISKNVTWDITPFLEIVGEIHSSYDQPFICTAYVTGLTNTAGGDCGSTADELAVSWNYPNPGSSFTSFPTDYDLEWAWVDNDAADAYKTNGSFDAEKIFFNNATRVTVPITQNCYKIPMLYDGAGFIFYRVRAVQVRTDGQIINGVWTTTLDADAGKYTLAAGHEESLNWQVSTTYAEDGKRKTVISYFDGTLRSRQTVTKDNSQETPSTVVAETFYDYQGRPTIQVLPAPTLNTVIAFTKNFNRAAGNEGYPKELYDILQTGQTVCGNGAPALDKTANLDGVRGAGNYYSPLNPKVNEGFNKFIPDANGYAFTETRYTQDATGRLLSQGGVGQLHQLGSTHETKYFYSSPSQDEIDILFGTDAGIASHYEKNMVRDANGQYSVSYVDMHGRTVATALTGVSPVNLEALPSLNGLPVPNPNNWNDVPKKQLLDPETNVVNGRSITMTKTLLVTSPGVRHFEYRLDPQQLQLNRCNPPGGTICYDCLYDLTITITNDCDNSVLFTDTRKNFSLPYNSVCGTNPADINFDFDVNISVEGSYTITKILTLSKDAQDQFRTNAMQYQNLVCKTKQSIYNGIRDIMLQQNANCQPTCAACTAALGSPESFRTAFITRMGFTTNEQMAPYEEAVSEAYNQAKADCDAICENGSDRVHNYRDIMLQDMMPDRGQYARIERDDLLDNSGNELPPVDITNKRENIFNSNISNGPRYRNPKTEDNIPDVYKDDYNKPDATGAKDLVDRMFPKDFAAAFKESWAKQLIYYHPEFKKLKLIEDPVLNMKDNVYRWQEQLQSKTTWAEVSATVTGLPGSDPFYTTILAGSSFQAQMLQKMSQWKYINFQISPSWIGMWQFAVASVKCEWVQGTPADMENCIHAVSNTIGVFPTEITCDADKDAIWKVFNAIYFTQREIFIYKYLQEKAPVDQTLFDAEPANSPFIQYQARFIDPEQGAQTYMSSDLNALFDEANNTTGSHPQADAALQAQYDENCRSYVAHWLDQMSVFDECSIDVNGNPIPPGDYTALTEQLVAICKAGSDLDHPLGSSSVPPGNNMNPGSFELALNNFLSAHGITPNEKCNAYVIDWPKPYDRSPSVGNEELWKTKPPECICNRINELNSLYQTAISPPVTFTGTFSEFMKQRFGTDISDATLNQLMNLCSVESGPQCHFLDQPIILPPALQCGASNEVCISCDEYNVFRTEFFSIFTVPSGITVPVMTPATDQEMAWNLAFARFMNYKTGFSKQWHEYALFEKGCTFSTEPINLENGICARLDNHITTFNNIFATLDDGTTDCQTLFTNYFNDQERTNFTYQQIKWIYNRCHPNSCTDVPISCGLTQPASPDVVIGNYDAYLVKLSDQDIWSPCSAYTPDLTVVNPSYSLVTTGVSFLGAVTINQPAISVDVIDVTPDKTTHCSDGTSAFQKTYGGNSNEMIYYIAAAADNGYVAAGQTSSYGHGANDGLLMKVDQNGNVVWTKVFGGTGDDIFYKVRRTSDNGFIACGQTKSYGNAAGDAWLVKISSTGNILWSKKYGDGNAYGDIAFDVMQTSDGGYSFCGAHNFAPFYSQSFVVRTDNQGNVIWSNSYGINSNSDGSYGILDEQGDILVSGIYQGGSYYDSYLMKLNKTTGAILWKQGYDAENRSTWFSGIAATNSGYQVYSPVSDNYNSTHVQGFVWNINSYGTVDNVRKLQVPGSTTKSYGWYPRSDGGFITANGENNSSSDVIYTRVNADGSMAWSNKITFEGDQVIYGITQGQSGELMAAGFTNARTVVVPPCGDPLPSHLCGLNLPIFPELEPELDDPCDDIYQLIDNSTIEALRFYLEKVKDDFDKAYQDKCLAVQDIESLTIQCKEEKEYHYTLYYYDQAGNLVQTVPPAGVDDFGNSLQNRLTFLADVKSARAAGTAHRPSHTLLTTYRYNTLGQVVEQKSPDGGLSKFWYDELGRLVVSQNAKQANPANSSEGNGTLRYSYILFDALGRITQVGQKPTNATIDQAKTRDKTELQNWLDNTGFRKEQITRTVYDLYYYNGIDPPGPALDSRLMVQRNLRNRVSYTQVVPLEPADFLTNPNAWVQAHSAATYYTYDIHGNVDELLQDYNEGTMKDVAGGLNRFKKIAYTYDLISGNVNTVTYQPDYYDVNDILQHHIDRFYHRYDYDAENKLVSAETSHDNIIWETDARYYYYKHWPLARTVLGQQQVQGIDYAYTLQCWLKGVNSTAISAAPTEDCAPGTGRDILNVFNRQQYHHPDNYVARQEINFFPEFVSDEPDNYVARIDPDLEPCIPIIASTPYITGDMGRDGKPESGNANRYTARDAYSFSLNYYQQNINGNMVEDYQSINQTEQPFTNAGMFNVLNNDDPTPKVVAKPLFNGNIASMFVNMPSLYTQPGGGVSEAGGAQLYGYQYDQLNRIVSMDAFGGFKPDENGWLNGIPTPTNNYKERISYDPNGNILTYLRNGALLPGGGGGPSPLAMDQLTYGYNKDVNNKLINNRLRHVKDDIGDVNYAEDIDSQPDDNYTYDEIGNLISDVKEDITKIEWTVYGKIGAIYKKDYTNIEYLAIEYKYDANGNRIQKTVYPPDRGVAKTTIYVRDASGNTMAVYEKKPETENGDLTQTEAHMYGISRLGIYSMKRNVENPVTNTDGIYTFERGDKAFELSNHLGNVLVTISDRKLQVQDPNNTTQILYYSADVITATDYYPFGMDMPGRKFGNEGRYGFNGKERDKDMNSLTAYDYGFRIYNPAIGKFLSVDPLTQKYPELTPYQYASNRPIDGIDVDGLEYGRYYWVRKYAEAKAAQQQPNASTIKQPLVPYMNTVSSNGDWLSGALLLPGNTYVKAYNTFAATTNSLVDLVEKSSKDGLGPGLMGWIDGIGEDLKDWFNGTVEYHTKTPVDQQLNDAIEWLKNPDNVYGAVSDGLIIYFCYRLQMANVSAPVYINKGTWVSESTVGWSKRAIRYQEHVTGVKAGNALEVNGVRFDGIRSNILLEAKGFYDNFVNSKTGLFHNWYLRSKTGASALLDQVQRQIKAANGATIEWHFNSQKALNATKSYFESQGINSGVNYVLNPEK